MIQDLIVDKKNPNLLAAAGRIYKSGAWTMGAFLSSNGGASWTTVPVGSQKNSDGCAIARDPSNPDTLYIGGQGGDWKGFLCKSTNGGASWTEITNGIQSGIVEIAVDPVSPKVVYAATWGAPWKSTDGGESWTVLSAWGVKRLVINPKNPNEVFAACGHNGVYYSPDKGATWQVFGSDTEVTNTLCVDFDPASRVLYAGTFGGGILKRAL